MITTQLPSQVENKLWIENTVNLETCNTNSAITEVRDEVKDDLSVQMAKTHESCSLCQIIQLMFG